MVALAGNFYIFTPCLTALLAAILLAVRNIAAAWNMRAFLILLVYHDNSSDRYCSGFSIFCSVQRLPFASNGVHNRVPVAIRDSTVLLCIVIAIKIPSWGRQAVRSVVELFRQGSEPDRARPSRTPKDS